MQQRSNSEQQALGRDPQLIVDPHSRKPATGAREPLSLGALELAPGAVVALCHNGQIIDVLAHGKTAVTTAPDAVSIELMRRSPQATIGNLIWPQARASQVTPNTRFRIASMTKSFLAATILNLEDAGEFDLQAPLQQYLPEVQLLLAENGVLAPQAVPCWMLLANCSGLVEDNPWGDRHLGCSDEQLLEYAAAGLLLHSYPGQSYQYSNTGMALLGLAAARAAGKPITELILERIIKPLGLTDTDFLPRDTDAQGCRSFDAGQSYVAEPYLGDGALACIGGLYSTAADIAKWMHFLGSAFTSAGQSTQILSAASRRKMQHGYTIMPARDVAGRSIGSGYASGYGLGLVVETDTQHGLIVSHAGGLPGFTSHMRWHPESGYGAVVFANTDAVSAESTACETLRKALAATTVPLPWKAVQHAAKALEQAVVNADLATIPEQLVAPNLWLDEPLAIRNQKLQKLLTTLGEPRIENAVTERLLPDRNPAAAKWRIPFTAGELEIALRVAGLSNPVVQALSITAVAT